MVAFFSRRLVRWLLMLIAIPVGVWVADNLAERIEGSRGPSKLTRTLRVPGRWRRKESLLAE